MAEIITALFLVLIFPLAILITYQRSQRIADDTENLIRNIFGSHSGPIERRNATRIYTSVDERLCNSLIRHFASLNAAQKSLRVVAGSAAPMSADAIIAEVNAMHKAEGRSCIPKSVMTLVLDGLQVGGLLVLRDGQYETSREGKLLNHLFYS